ncbi:MAG: DEAD/DEAH box helicase [Nocardioidaceae bacterium]
MGGTYNGHARQPGGMAAVYRELAADQARTEQIAADVDAALARGRHCLVLTQWTAHLTSLAARLREARHDPVVLRGGMGAKTRTAAIQRLTTPSEQGPLLVVATGPYGGEGFDCPPLDTLFLAAPIAFKDASSNTPGASCAPTPARPPPKSTTTTTPPPPSSRPPSPNAPPATPASDSPTLAESSTGPPREVPRRNCDT